MSKYIIGIDIGGTKCAVTCAEVSGEKIEFCDKVKFSTEINTPALEIIDKFSEIINKFSADRKPDAIGISCGGPLDSKCGVIMSPPNLPNWDNIHIVEILQEKFAVPVFLQNDANACALAEWKYGAGKGSENMAFLTFGTGLGAGLILNGKLYTGTNDNAGEVGHIRLSENGPIGYGKVGSFEGFCSGGGLKILGYLLGLEAYQNGVCPGYFNPENPFDTINAKSIADAADNGDKTAIEVYKKCGEYLGRGLSILIDILNPDTIVIGSIFKRSANLLWEPAKEIIEKEALSLSANVCKVVPAELDSNLGDIAAVTTAVYGLEENNND